MFTTLLAQHFHIALYIGLPIGLFLAYVVPSTLRRWRNTRTINRIPGPRAFPIIGTTWLFMGIDRDRIHERIRDSLQPYGRLVRTWMGSMPTVIFQHAEQMELILGSSNNHGNAHSVKSWQYAFVRPWLGTGLLTADTDAAWHAHRRIITPAFHFSILEGFCEVFAEQSAVLVAKMREVAGTGAEVPVYPLLTLATLDMITEAAMGTQLGVQTATEDNAYTAAVYEASGLIIERGIRPWHHADWMYALSANGRRFEKYRQVLHEFTEGVIAKRRAARRVDGGTSESTENDDTPKKRLAFLDLLLEQDQAGQLSNRELREEVDTFMFAGHDTTTANLAWTIWLLAHHAEVQERIFEEMEAIFAEGENTQRSASIRDLNGMKYLERVIKESLRMYPSAPIIGRKVSETLQVDGYEIPAGTEVELHIYQLHRDERYFPEPNRFDPDRFLPENLVGRHAFAYLPFSAGSRNCVGQKFALYEEKSVLSALVRNFRFSVPVGSRLEDERQILELTSKPHRGAPVIIERRH